jgi:hypothetical protein
VRPTDHRSRGLWFFRVIFFFFYVRVMLERIIKVTEDFGLSECDCCVLSVRDLCVRLITVPEDCSLSECDCVLSGRGLCVRLITGLEDWFV